MRDIEDVAAFISRDSPRYAAAFAERLHQAPEGVLLFPEAAATVVEYERNDIRETYVGVYRVIFRFDADFVTVLAVIHSARDLRRTWRPDRPT